MGNEKVYLNNPLVEKFKEYELKGYPGNYFLYAGGGYGKTTALQCLFLYLRDEAIKGEKIAPLYIDVKQIDYSENKPIINYIYSMYSGEDTSIEDVKNLFSDQAPAFSKKYKYYILIDGYNEANEDAKSNINSDIRALMVQKNVKLVVSSRISEQANIFSDFKRLSLLGLDDQQIEKYLNHEFAKFRENANAKKINKSLIEILRIPLFMYAFSQTYNEKSPYPDLYEEKTVRKADILDSFIWHTLKKLKKEENINDLLVEFVVMYFLPTIAFDMVKNSGFIIEDKDFSSIRDDINCFEKLLSTEQQGIYLKNYILNKYDIEKICCDNITLLNRTSEGYTLHQIWRDFFAAKHVINCMNAKLLDELEILVDENVRQFSGELIREFDDNYKYSKSYKIEDCRRCECDFEEKNDLETWPKSPIEHFMQKNYLSLNKNPMVIRNLIEIMKTSRNNCITANYSNLDLTECSFVGAMMPSSIFINCKVKYDNFIYLGHKDTVLGFDISKNCDYCITSGDKRIIRWDLNRIKSYKCVYTSSQNVGYIKIIYFNNIDYVAISTNSEICIISLNDIMGTEFFLKGHKDHISIIEFIEDENILLSGTFNGEIKIWNFAEKICLDTFSYNSELRNISWNSEEKSIYCFLSNGNIIKYDLFKMHHYIIDCCDSNFTSVHICSFLSDGISYIYWNSTNYWNGSNNHLFIKKIGSEEKNILNEFNEYWIDNITVSLKDKYYAFSYFNVYNGELQIWNLETKELYRKKNIKEKILCIKFINDNSQIIICTFNGSIIIWNIEYDICTTLISSYTGGMNYASFYNHKSFAVSMHYDNFIREWDITKRKLAKIHKNYSANAFDCCFYNNNKNCAFIKDGSIIFRDVENERNFKSINIFNNESIIYRIVINKLNTVLLCIGLERLFVISLVPKIEILHVYESNVDSFCGIAFSNIDNDCFFFDNQNNLIQFDYERGITKNSIYTNSYIWIKIIAFNQGTKVAASDLDGNLKIWDIVMYNEDFLYKNSDEIILSIITCCNDKYIIAGGSNGNIYVWKTENYELFSTIKFNGRINYIESYLDSSILICVCDNEFHIYDFIENKHYLKMDEILSGNLIDCFFSNLDYKDKNLTEFYKTLYYNGAVVPDKYIPKNLESNKMIEKE